MTGVFMRSMTARLLCGAVISAFALSASAQARVADVAVTADTRDTAGAPNTAPVDATDAANDQGSSSANDIVVLGFGRSRQVQSVTALDIDRLPPGTSALKAIAKLPGVNFQAADPFGAYEWAVRISLRGFNQNQLGFTLDDVPLGDMSYGNVNGLHISRAIISENIGRAEVAQGAGSLATASTSNLGGTIQFYSDKPSDQMHLKLSGTYGADDTYRGYVRFDTGDVTGNGLKAYLSYGYLTTNKWKGTGPQRQHQANAKVVQDLGALGNISLFFDYSRRRETDYQDLTLNLFDRLGSNAAYRVDNIRPNYGLAVAIANAYHNNTPYPAPYQNVDDVYYDAGGLRDDYLAGATFDAHLAPGFSIKTTGYYHTNKGQGSWFNPYAVTPAGALDQNGNVIANPAPLAFRTTEYGIHRGGMLTNATFESGPNTLEIGGWYESNNFHQARRYYGLSADSQIRETLEFQQNPYFTQYEGFFTTITEQYHVSDTLKLFDDKLVINGGWKGQRVANKANVTAGGLANGSISTKDWFLPQVGAVFHISPMLEIFGDYNENQRAFVSALTSGPFSTTQDGFNALVNGSATTRPLRPESSKTYEGGLRFHQGPFQASAVGYYIDFSNRLISFANGAGIVGNPAVLANVGSVHTYGAEFTANYRVIPSVSLFGSYSYNHSEYQDNVLLASGAVQAYTAGKTVIDSPRHMAKGEVVYDNGNLFARVGGDYMSKRFFSYENDLVAAGRFVGDASAGYRFTGEGFLNKLSIEVSVTNFTDKQYIGTVNTNNVQVRGYTNTPNNPGAPNGLNYDFDNGNFMVGAPRQWFVTVKKEF